MALWFDSLRLSLFTPLVAVLFCFFFLEQLRLLTLAAIVPSFQRDVMTKSGLVQAALAACGRSRGSPSPPSIHPSLLGTAAATNSEMREKREDGLKLMRR